MKDLMIIGAGGFGREVVELVRDINKSNVEYNFLGFIDDNETGTTVEGDKIIGTLDEIIESGKRPLVVIAIANAVIREQLAIKCRNNGFSFATLIHPTVEIGPYCEIGEGSIICKKTNFTTNVKVGQFCIINEKCAIGHDTVFEDYVSIMSDGLFGGESHIGKGCYFGLRSTVINRIEMVPYCTIGAGCVVVRNLDEKGTYVGVPAKRVK